MSSIHCLYGSLDTVPRVFFRRSAQPININIHLLRQKSVHENTHKTYIIHSRDSFAPSGFCKGVVQSLSSLFRYFCNFMSELKIENTRLFLM